jgi:hypothetical protein
MPEKMWPGGAAQEGQKKWSVQVDEQGQVIAGEVDGVPESASAEWLA